jgi:hypothetical protein
VFIERVGEVDDLTLVNDIGRCGGSPYKNSQCRYLQSALHLLFLQVLHCGGEQASLQSKEYRLARQALAVREKFALESVAT